MNRHCCWLSLAAAVLGGIMSSPASGDPPPPPSNDDCTSAITIDSELPFVDTVAIGSAEDDGDYLYRGVWYEYTPIVDQYLSLKARVLVGGAPLPGVFGYVVPQELCGQFIWGGSEFRVYAGTTYYFLAALDSGNIPENSMIEFTIDSLGPVPLAPSNDLLQNAALIMFLPYEDVWNPAGATTDSTDSLCGSPGISSVWYRYIPNDNRRIRISGVNKDAYRGDSFENLMSVFCDQNIKLWLDVSAGEEYYFRQYAPYIILEDRYRFSIDPVMPTVNDFCVNAIDITSIPEGAVMDILGTSFSTEDPPVCPTCYGPGSSCSYLVFYQSIYFTFTPAVSGELTVNAINADNNAYLNSVVSTGECGDLQPVQCVAAGIPSPIHLEAGVRYTILLGTIDEEAIVNYRNILAIRPIFNFVPDVAACPADFNGDSVRDVADLFAYINAWLAKTAPADFNNDSAVDVADLFGFINAWLAGC